jgi:ZIP family zinc transporter
MALVIKVRREEVIGVEDWAEVRRLHRTTPLRASASLPPLAAGGERPSWLTLLGLGLIGGGPTFLGTLIGPHLVNETLSIAFLGLAAGSMLYVVIELSAVARRAGLKTLTTWCILLGLLLGFATDAVVTGAGA